MAAADVLMQFRRKVNYGLMLAELHRPSMAAPCRDNGMLLARVVTVGLFPNSLRDRVSHAAKNGRLRSANVSLVTGFSGLLFNLIAWCKAL